MLCITDASPGKILKWRKRLKNSEQIEDSQKTSYEPEHRQIYHWYHSTNTLVT